jgi:copper(I)-binding protein
MTTMTRSWRAGSVSLVLAVCAVAGVASGAEASARSLPACSAAGLSARATGAGAGMSQPAVYVTVTNTSSTTCTLFGYPTITRAVTKNGRQSITVSKGGVMNAPQAKPKRIVLAANGHAWFAIGAATAYDPPVVTFTRIRFATASGGPTATARISLQASAPSGKPFPLGVTPFMAGVGTSQ